jgi:hypothetical protein
MDVLARHNITPDLADVESTFGHIYRAVWAIDAQIKSADQTPADAPKVSNPFDTEAEKDDVAKETANVLLDTFLTMATNAIEQNHNVAYWLSEMSKRFGSFMTSEVGYYRWQATKETGVKSTDDSNTELREDRRVLVDLLRKLFALDEDGLSKVQGVKTSKGKNGNVLLDLPSIKGPRGGGDTPTGKFSRMFYVQWNVDGENFPAGTDSRVIIRFVWTGVERTGKKPGDLYDAWQEAGGKDCKPGQSVSFTLNGKAIVATMVEEENDD